PWFVNAIAKENHLNLELPGAGRRANDSMPGHVFGSIDGFFAACHKKPEKAKITILGFSFKTNSGDCRFTPVAPLIEYLKKGGYGNNLKMYDPMVAKNDADSYEIVLEPDFNSAVEGADALLLLAAHNEFADSVVDDLAKNLAPNGLVYDGRIYLDKS